MKIQVSTTPEQSRRLIACGVNPESADMCYIGHHLDSIPYEGMLAQWMGDSAMKGRNRKAEDFDLSPAWSLSALLALLPKEIDIDGYTYRISIYFENPEEPIIGNHWCLYYKPKKRNERGRIDDVTMYATDLIECAVLMVEWLTANGYKLNEI